MSAPLTPLPFVSFWRGPIGWMERLCIQSMLRHGARLSVYSYEPLGLPAGVEARDARVIIPEGTPSHALINEQVAAFADVFRYQLMRRGLGIWVDLDLYFLRPLGLTGPYIFGWEKVDRVNNAVLLMPSDCPVLGDLIAFCERRPVLAPWWRRKHIWRQRLAIAVGRPLPLSRFPKAQFGPKALTYFLGQQGILDKALPQATFYPVAPQDHAVLLGPSAVVERLIDARTIAVHLWSSDIKRRLAGRMPPPDSYIGHLLISEATACA